MVNRECGICGNVFGVKGYDKRSKYCSVECRGESRRLRQAEYRKTDRGITNTKRYNSKFKRPDIERECLCCNDKFITARESKLFCDKEECRKSARSYNIRVGSSPWFPFSIRYIVGKADCVNGKWPGSPSFAR